MTAEKPARRTSGKRGSAGKVGNAPAPGMAKQPGQERRYVDIDPWAMLLEGLMDMPEEVPPERTRPKGK
jgi:hypothetical protein